MKILTQFLKTKKKTSHKRQPDQKQEALVKLGREQFKKLIDKGLGVPVALL